MRIDNFLQYLRFERRFSEHTVAAYRRDLSQFAEYLLQTLEIQDDEQIRHHQIRSWVVDLVGKKQKAASISRKLSAVKSYFKYLKRRGFLTSNPASKISSPRQGKRLPVYVLESDMEAVLQAREGLTDFPSRRDELVLHLLYACGLRRSELISLQVKDLDLKAGTLRVFGKGAKERMIPVPQALRQKLQDYLELRRVTFPDAADVLLLSDKGGALYPRWVYGMVRKNLEGKAVGRKSPHVLRHTYATHLSDHGADLNAIKSLLGHASLASTQVYTHNSVERLLQVYRQAHPLADE